MHRVQEETFYVIEGECEWQVGDRLVRATPGTYLFIPPGVPHDIRNASDKPARMLMTVSPPGHEHYFEELAKAGRARQARRTPMPLPSSRNRYDTTQLIGAENEVTPNSVLAGRRTGPRPWAARPP